MLGAFIENGEMLYPPLQRVSFDKNRLSAKGRHFNLHTGYLLGHTRICLSIFLQKKKSNNEKIDALLPRAQQNEGSAELTRVA